jgi:hypothetical protein
MIFGYDKYIELVEGLSVGQKFPLPNGRVDADSIKKDFNTLSKYDVYCALFNKDINFTGFGFGHDSVDTLISQNKKFVYPILIHGVYEFHRLSNPDVYKIPENVIDTVKKGNAIILLAYLFEGDLYPNNLNTANGINLFAETYGLDKKNILVLSNNLLFKYYQPERAKFTVKPFNYFLMSPWFLPSQFIDENFTKYAKDSFSRRLNQYCSYEKPYRFLSFNRRPRPHRIALFTEIKKSKALSKNTLISLGNKQMDDNYKERNTSYRGIYDMLVEDTFRYDKQAGLDYLSSYNENKETVIDTGLEYNHALTINETLHTSTFVNILTETLYDNKTIFFSEKIWKPIYAGQPFIVLGNPGILKELKKLGFMTFDKFWDESYDKEQEFTRRLELVLDTVNYINSLSDAQIQEISHQMYDILKHNFFNYIEKSKEELFKLKHILNEALN